MKAVKTGCAHRSPRACCSFFSQVAWAASNWGELGSIPGGSSWLEPVGSGKVGYPCVRRHSATFRPKASFCCRCSGVPVHDRQQRRRLRDRRASLVGRRPSAWPSCGCPLHRRHRWPNLRRGGLTTSPRCTSSADSLPPRPARGMGPRLRLQEISVLAEKTTTCPCSSRRGPRCGPQGPPDGSVTCRTRRDIPWHLLVERPAGMHSSGTSVTGALLCHTSMTKKVWRRGAGLNSENLGLSFLTERNSLDPGTGFRDTSSYEAAVEYMELATVRVDLEDGNVPSTGSRRHRWTRRVGQRPAAEGHGVAGWERFRSDSCSEATWTSA